MNGVVPAAGTTSARPRSIAAPGVQPGRDTTPQAGTVTVLLLMGVPSIAVKFTVTLPGFGDVDVN